MRWLLLLLPIVLCGCHTALESTVNPQAGKSAPHGGLERVVVASDGSGFVTAQTKRPFQPWGLNYGNSGRLMEDFWIQEWRTVSDDFREMRQLGANVVRVHLQFGKFMEAPNKPNRAALRQLNRLLRLAEETGLYLDVTGLACYRPADAPKWYDAMDEPARWAAQASFWESIAEVCAPSSSVFCYDLINEPLSPGEKRDSGKWPSGRGCTRSGILVLIA